jgi:hypothetical protein
MRDDELMSKTIRKEKKKKKEKESKSICFCKEKS